MHGILGFGWTVPSILHSALTLTDVFVCKTRMQKQKVKRDASDQPWFLRSYAHSYAHSYAFFLSFIFAFSKLEKISHLLDFFFFLTLDVAVFCSVRILRKRKIRGCWYRINLQEQISPADKIFGFPFNFWFYLRYFLPAYLFL